MKVRLFPLPLTGSAFSWFSLLPPNSIRGWADLEKQFHKYFFAGNDELKLTDLISVEQQKDNQLWNILKNFVISAADVIV